MTQRKGRSTSLVLVALAMIVMPLVSSASSVVLEQVDFSSAQTKVAAAGTLVEANLSESGLDKLSHESLVGTEIEFRVAGVSGNLKLRDPITGSQIEFGPFADDVAQKIVGQINHPTSR